MADETPVRRRSRLKPGAVELSPEARDKMLNSLPHNPDMERAVIAGILMDPAHCVPIVLASISTPDAFYVPRFALIFKVVQSLFAQNRQDSIDILTIAHELEKLGQLEILGGDVALAELQNTISTVANFDHWVEIVREHYQRRQMINVCRNAIEISQTLLDHHQLPLTVPQALDSIESDILRVRNETLTRSNEDFPDLVCRTYDNIEKTLRGEIVPAIATGYKDIDSKIQGGLKRGEMTVIAARPSIGKTAFSLNIVHNILKNSNAKVAFFSLEMTAEQLVRRLLCTESGVSASEIYHETPRSGMILSKLTDAISRIRNYKLYIDDTPQLRIMELRAKSRRLMQDHKIDAVFVDYLQLMRGSGNAESRQQEVAEISAGLKALAKELDIPVVALAQLSRESEQDADKGNARPKLSHLRESGAIEQDADIVAFLHRDRKKQKEITPEERDSGLPAECIIEKNRNGEVGIVNLLFFPRITKFTAVEVHRFDPNDRPLRK